MSRDGTVLKRVKRNPSREVSHIQIAQAHIQTQVVTSQGVYEVRVKVQHTRPISPKNLIIINKIINKYIDNHKTIFYNL